MRRLLSAQLLLNLPSLSFLLLLAAMLFLLQQEELLTPVNTETVSSDIVWSRHNETGEIVRLEADYLTQKSDGIVRVEGVHIKVDSGEHYVDLRSPHGYTDSNYEKIYLTTPYGELNLGSNARITLSLTQAVYHLDGSMLQGDGIIATQDNQKFTGGSVIWDGKKISLKNNVRVIYTPQTAK